MKFSGLIVSAATLLLVSPVQAAPPRYGVFVYSNVCWESESGDAAGHRVVLIRDGDGDRLAWEYSEGALDAPIPASELSIDDKTSKITFDIDYAFSGQLGHEPPEIKHYSGTISADALVLEPSDDIPRTERLARIKDFRGRIGECK